MSNTGLINSFTCSFQKLNIPSLDMEISKIFGLILQHYASEVEFVKKVSHFYA